LERKWAAKKARAHSALEADLVASMGHECPQCLHSKDKKELASHDKGFAARASYEQWISGGSQSFSFMLNSDFNSSCRGLSGRIPNWSVNPGDLLAQCLITTMSAQFTKLMAFIPALCRESVAVAKGRDDEQEDASARMLVCSMPHCECMLP
jgi:hypothetical protein